MVNSLAVLFCELLIAIFLATLIGAFILKVACALYNLLAGAAGKPPIDTLENPIPVLGPDGDQADFEHAVESPGVPIPRFEWAMRIIFFATLVNTTGSFIVLRVVRLAGQAFMRRTFESLPIFLVASPLGMLVLGGICAAMLPTSFGKGLLVSLLFHFLTILIAAILAAVVVLVALSYGFAIPRFD